MLVPPGLYVQDPEFDTGEKKCLHSFYIWVGGGVCDKHGVSIRLFQNNQLRKTLKMCLLGNCPQSRHSEPKYADDKIPVTN